MQPGLDQKIPELDYPAFAGIPVSEKYKKVNGIAVLGSHAATVEKAPFHDDSWLIFACSPHNLEHRTLPRVDMWSETHKPVQDKTRSYRYLKAVSELPCPVVMRDLENMGQFPNAVVYPEAAVTEDFGPFFKTSSIALMMAIAIQECERNGYERLGLWGIMQASNQEFVYQRPWIQALIWQAVERGIDVYAPRESALFEPPAEVW